MQIEGKKRDLALFNLAIDSKLRGCDVVAVRVDDIAPSGYSMDRATIRQKKTGRPVRFELTDQTRQAVDEYLRLTGRKAGQFLFAGRGDRGGLTTRQYARLVQEWVASIGLDPAKFGTHSLRRTKASRLSPLSTAGCHGSEQVVAINRWVVIDRNRWSSCLGAGKLGEYRIMAMVRLEAGEVEIKWMGRANSVATQPST